MWNQAYRDMQQLLKAQDLATIINVTSRTIMNWYYGGIIPARLHVGKVMSVQYPKITN